MSFDLRRSVIGTLAPSTCVIACTRNGTTQSNAGARAANQEEDLGNHRPGMQRSPVTSHSALLRTCKLFRRTSILGPITAARGRTGQGMNIAVDMPRD